MARHADDATRVLPSGRGLLNTGEGVSVPGRKIPIMSQGLAPGPEGLEEVGLGGPQWEEEGRMGLKS